MRHVGGAFCVFGWINSVESVNMIEERRAHDDLVFAAGVDCAEHRMGRVGGLEDEGGRVLARSRRTWPSDPAPLLGHPCSAE